MSKEVDGIIRWKTCKKHKKDYLVYCPDCRIEKERGIIIGKKCGYYEVCPYYQNCNKQDSSKCEVLNDE